MFGKSKKIKLLEDEVKMLINKLSTLQADFNFNGFAQNALDIESRFNHYDGFKFHKVQVPILHGTRHYYSCRVFLVGGPPVPKSMCRSITLIKLAL